VLERNKIVDVAAVVGRGYGEFWHSHHRYRVVKGGKASKKSATAALWYIYHLMLYPDANLLVVRGALNTHLSSTFAQLRWAIRRLGAERYWRANTSPPELRYLPTGQKIMFRGMDDADKLASVTVESGYLCWVWVEEAFEIRSELDFDKLDLSVPRGNVPPPLFKQTTLTFNPWNDRHWLKKRFFECERDNALVLTTDYRCNEFLDDADLAVYETMRVEQPRRYAVAGLGEWGVAEGLVFDRWTVEEFDVGRLLDGGDAWRFKHVFGLDYGYTNDPTAFIAMAVDPVGKRIFVYDEHYKKRMHNDEIAGMIREKGFAKEKIRADSAEPKSNDDLRRLGITRIAAAAKGRDSVLHGISELQAYHIFVLPGCVHTIAELSAYVWGGDRPEDRNNHLMDAMRYAMEDARCFKPESDVARCAHKRERRRAAGRMGAGGITANDLTGGWN